jgi:hypothetical protein
MTTRSSSPTDASPAGSRSGSADIDLVPPVISGVEASTRFGRLVVSWDTDEDADAIVDFGTSAALGSSVTNRGPDTLHRVAVDGLAAIKPCSTGFDPATPPATRPLSTTEANPSKPDWPPPPPSSWSISSTISSSTTT